MDQITSSYSDSSSSSSSSSYKQHSHSQKITKSIKQSYPYNSLHSVRKPITKHFIAPLPPTPLKIYNVDSSEFKEAVRILTSTPKFQYSSPRRLKDKPRPPPLVLSTIPKASLLPKSPPPSPPSLPLLDDREMMSPLSEYMMSQDFWYGLLNETMQTTNIAASMSPGGMDYRDPSPGGALMSPLGFCLSPASLSWCSSVLLSSGTLPAMNQSSVL